MKLIIVLLTTVILQVSASTYGQNVTLKRVNAPLKSVLNEIGKQTGYDFFYSEKLISAARPVSLNINNVNIAQALELCFKDQALTYSIENKAVTIKLKEASLLDRLSSTVKAVFKSIDVKGKVVDQDGKPLPNSSIRVKGKSAVTNTNQNGEFEIKDVAEEAVLLISYVGYKTLEVPVKGAVMPLEIKLNVQTGELEEVNVTYNTGYENIPKERATGSFTFVDNKTLNAQVGTGILERLNGVSSGTLFDGKRVSPSGIGNKRLPVTVRGLSTINGPADPLIVLDNFPYEGDLNNINPNDVENISILKDAAAASIWGSKAGNGVIVITTKKGKLNEKFKLDVTSNISITDKPDLFSLSKINTSDIIDLELFLFSKKYKFSDTLGTGGPTFSQVYEILFKRKNGQITPADSARQIDALRNVDVRNDFSKYMYRQAVNQQYAINLRGGSTNAAWLFSAGYDKNISELYDKYSRINIRAENTFVPVKNLQIRSGITYTNSHTEDGRTAYDEIVTSAGYGITPYTRFYDESHRAMPFAINYRQGYLDTVGKGKLLDWNYYPAEDYKHQSNKAKQQDFLGNFEASYKLGDLKLSVNYLYERQQTETNLIYDEQIFTTRDLINRFTQINKVTGAVTYKVPKGSIRDLSRRTVENQAFRGMLSYNKTWDLHSLTALAGTEIRNAHTGGDTYRTYGYNSDILTQSNVDYTTQYPDYATGVNAFIPNRANFDDLTNRFVSFYMNGAYSFKQKYTLSASARRDASNLFGVNTNDKWTPLWSAGLSWELSKEKFYHFPLIPYLKLRATYGFQGNVDQTLSAVTTISYSSTLNPFTSTPSSQIINFYNPDLRWEKVGTKNIGLDFSSSNSRVNGSLDVYEKVSKDLFGIVPIDLTAGLGRSLVTRNAGSLRTRGLELLLNSRNIDRAFKWNSTFILNLNKDKITDYHFTGGGVLTVVSGKAVEIGRSVYGIYSYPWAGLDPNTGEARGYLNGEISKSYSAMISDTRLVSDLIYHGSDMPTCNGSIINTLSYKGFTLSALLAFRLGYYFRRPSIEYTNLYSTLSGHSDYYKRWQKPGDELTTDVPALLQPNPGGSFYRLAEVLVEKGDHVRLQYVNLAYQLEPAVLKRLKIKQLEMFTNISNLGIIWRANKLGIDPDNQQLSVPKRIAFGLRASL